LEFLALKTNHLATLVWTVIAMDQLAKPVKADHESAISLAQIKKEQKITMTSFCCKTVRPESFSKNDQNAPKTSKSSQT
jgi:hypothetical protein